MVRLSRADFEIMLTTLNASLRRAVKDDAKGDGEYVTFGEYLAADVYGQVMDYVTLNGFDQSYNITPQGRQLEMIGDLIFDQSGG